jgi:hypothetical protein
MKDLPTIISDLKKLTEGKPWGLMDRVQAYIKVLESEKGKPKQRTATQNRSLHLGFTAIANTLNETGRTMRQILKPEVEIPWTTQTVKDFLYRPILEAYTGKKSTTEMDKFQPGEVWDIMFKFLGEHHGVEYMPFPSQTDGEDWETMARKIK